MWPLQNYSIKGKSFKPRRKRLINRSTLCAKNAKRKKRFASWHSKKTMRQLPKRHRRSKKSKIDSSLPNTSRRNGIGSRPKVNSWQRNERKEREKVVRKRRSEIS